MQINKIKQRLAMGDQILTLTSTTWSDYKELDRIEYSHYLISYLNHEITIMSPGRNHEKISKLMGIIIETYCFNLGTSYYPFGSTRLFEEGKVGKEPDQAYAFNTDKDKPDLAVEINFTSGTVNDLDKYKLLKIKEVWIRQNQELKFYSLAGDRYLEIEMSIHLDQIKSATLVKYINRGLTEDFLGIQKDFVNFITKQ